MIFEFLESGSVDFFLLTYFINVVIYTQAYVSS